MFYENAQYSSGIVVVVHLYAQKTLISKLLNSSVAIYSANREEECGQKWEMCVQSVADLQTKHSFALVSRR